MFNDKTVQKELVTYVVDLDNLKPINDSFGHDVGDKFIIYTSEILKEVFGNNSYIFRMGGDEFYVVTFLELSNLKEEIKNFNKNIDKLIQKKRRDIDKPFNLSYGYAVRRSYENIDQTFKRADESMYKNKQKNKIDR
jgi:diguanylate cyclase (GGDEF)-like protein